LSRIKKAHEKRCKGFILLSTVVAGYGLYEAGKDRSKSRQNETVRRNTGAGFDATLCAAICFKLFFKFATMLAKTFAIVFIVILAANHVSYNPWN
jgi:hypothetical protein